MYKIAARNIKREILYKDVELHHLRIIAEKIDHSWELKYYMLKLTSSDIQAIIKRNHDNPVEQRL